MRAAPNWFCIDDPVDGVWKQDLLRWVGKELDIYVLVETGTCEGSTILAVHNDFKLIHSIELSDRLFDVSKQRLRGLQNVVLYHGDSRTFLPQIIAEIPQDEKILFWLDAHPCGGASADAGDPLPAELEIIDRLVSPDRAVIIIDDMKSAELQHVAEAGITLDRWQREYRTGEIFLYGKLVVPPFEDFTHDHSSVRP